MERRYRRLALVLVAIPLIIALLVGCALSDETQGDQPSDSTVAEQDPRSASLGRFLSDLAVAYETPSTTSMQAIAEDLESVRDTCAEDYVVAEQVADTWSAVYLNPDYPLYAHGSGDTAEELASAGIPNDATQAFVVLGYELKDGEMTDELKGRCDAAAAAARAYPDALLVCTGGETGVNNPAHHTEAGMMKAYLVETYGIDAERIFADEAAKTTVDNAMNCLDIMQRHGVQTMTLITSTYHQRWAQVVFSAARALRERETGYAVKNTANYSFVCDPSEEVYLQDDRIAVMQVAEMLGVAPEDLAVQVALPETPSS